MIRSFSFRKNPRFWLVAIAGLVVDQLTKFWVAQTFGTVGHSWPVWPDIFHLTYVLNTGAAFSAFRGGVGWLKWLSLAVSVGLMIFAGKIPLRPLEQVGYGCILAGAFGNGIDRFLFGHVIDFFDFRVIHFPIFNVADVLINIGIGCLLLASFRPSHQNPPNHGVGK